MVGRICFLSHSCHWQNSLLCAAGTKDPISLLAVGQDLLQTPSTFLGMWPLHLQGQQWCFESFSCI